MKHEGRIELRKAAGKPAAFLLPGDRFHPDAAAPHHRTTARRSNERASNPGPKGSGTKGMGTKMLAPLSSEEFSPDWWDEAVCRDGEGSLAKVFFSEELQDIARAKNLCAECPAMLTCLEGAIARREPWGVWGGQLFLNGRILATKRRRGRPPKHPRPEDKLPEIPVPVQFRSYLRTA